MKDGSGNQDIKATRSLCKGLRAYILDQSGALAIPHHLHYLANAGPILWAELPFKISAQDILWILSTHPGSLGVGKYNAPILHNHKTIGGVVWEIHRLSGY